MDVFFIHHGAPALGLVLSQLLFFSPAGDVLAARRRGSLGTLNPWPFVFLVLNAAGMIVYGLDIGDPYICATNFPGAIIGLWYVMQVLPLVPDLADRARLELVTLLSLGLWVGAGLMRALALSGVAWVQTAFAWMTIVGMTLFFGSPLSSLTHIMQQRDASSILPRLATLSLVNCTCWCAYGAIAVHNPFIMAPNALGGLLALVQLALRAWYPPIDDTIGELVLIEQGHDATKRTGSSVHADGSSSSALTPSPVIGLPPKSAGWQDSAHPVHTLGSQLWAFRTSAKARACAGPHCVPASAAAAGRGRPSSAAVGAGWWNRVGWRGAPRLPQPPAPRSLAETDERAMSALH